MAADDAPGSSGWSDQDLAALDREREVRIAVRRSDGTVGRGITIWLVVADDAAYVRTWQRRDTGWYGGVRRSGLGRVETATVLRDVDVVPAPPASRDAVDAAYRRKYGDAGAASMTTEEAVASTLRLDPA